MELVEGPHPNMPTWDLQRSFATTLHKEFKLFYAAYHQLVSPEGPTSPLVRRCLLESYLSRFRVLYETFGARVHKSTQSLKRRMAEDVVVRHFVAADSYVEVTTMTEKLVGTVPDSDASLPFFISPEECNEPCLEVGETITNLQELTGTNLLSWEQLFTMISNDVGHLNQARTKKKVEWNVDQLMGLVEPLIQRFQEQLHPALKAAVWACDNPWARLPLPDSA